jgi:hypothetical protein
VQAKQVDKFGNVRQRCNDEKNCRHYEHEPMLPVVHSASHESATTNTR